MIQHSNLEMFKTFVKNNDVRCSKCGTKWNLTVDHKDGDRSHNSWENFQCLCIWHHFIKHLKHVVSTFAGMKPIEGTENRIAMIKVSGKISSVLRGLL